MNLPIRRLVFTVILGSIPWGAGAWVAACGSDEGQTAFTNDAGAAGEVGADDRADVGSADLVLTDQLIGDTSTCPQGQSCGDGGICTADKCCQAALACGPACCDMGQVCSFERCQIPGAVCTDSSDCGSNEYCEYALGESADGGTPDSGGVDSGVCVAGAQPMQGRCLPKPPVCTDPDAGPPACLQKCEYRPPTPDFAPVQKYQWGGAITAPFADDVMMTPIVVQLDDDDCDGKVTEKDIPEILFSTYSNVQYTSPGTLHAISIINGAVVDKWSVDAIQPTCQLAGGNIDGQPGNEVIVCGGDGTVIALTGAGQQLWKSAAITCFEPAIADLDGDGTVEVVVEGGILDGRNGQTKAVFQPPMEGTFLVSDLDGDGELDVVANAQAYHADGSQFVDTGVTGHAYTGYPWYRSGPAIADFDKDGKPEVVAVYFMQHAMAVWRYDATSPSGATFIRASIDINGTLLPTMCPDGSAGSKWGGGPATVGDFNIDGVPDIALAGGVGYAVFDGAKIMDSLVADADTFLWVKQTHDCSSAGTGSSLFDFDGDGRPEVVYNDEYYLRIYRGETGDVLFETCNTTGTQNEYPVIADVDNDGQADIVVVANAGFGGIECDGRQAGVRVFTSASGSWVRTRRTWNEHAYHITNVLEDGTIPTHEAPNWTQAGLNNFRLNKQPGQEFAAPDAIVSLSARCGNLYELAATVRNVGEAILPSGITIGFYQGSPPAGTKLGEAKTSKALFPAQGEVVVLALANPSPSLLNGVTPAYAKIEDTTLHECRTDNNSTGPVSVKCEAVH